jgi:surface antigen
VSVYTGLLRPASCLVAALLLAGCSMTMPLGPLVSQDDVTGSIRKVCPLSPDLDPEDWRRAAGAMNIALDPQGNGLSVQWDNPQSGAHGVFTPVAKPYPVEAKICRAFVADLEKDGKEHTLQGTACSQKGGDWILTDVAPFKKS